MKHCYQISLCLLMTMFASITQAATNDALERQIRGLNDRLSAIESRFRINGFATFGIAQSDEEVPYDGIGNETTFRDLTLAGIQMTFNIDDKSSVVTQMLARGTEDFNTVMEWAYFKHNITSEISAKLGRIRGPYYMLSEYLDVGYAVPWTSMPAETYGPLSPFSNLEGIDLTWDGELGGFGAQAQLIHGRITGETFAGDDVYSLGFTLSGDTWSVRIGHSQSTTVLEDPDTLAASSAYGYEATVDGAFQGLGFRWEPDDLLLMGEYTTFTTPDSVLADEDAVYLTVGYRIGLWMPHLTYAQAESTDDEDRELSVIAESTGFGTEAALLAAANGGNTTAQSLVGLSQLIQASNTNTNRIGVGVRYDYAPGIAMKLQYDIVTVDDAAGLFNDEAYVAANAADDAPESANILSFTIDTVF